MCGRYLAVSTSEALAEHFAVDEVRTGPMEPRYNIAPSTEVPAVVDHQGSRRLGSLRWGFVPHWVKTLKGAPQPINARVETVATNRMFAPAFARQRCLLPADGFYEWLDRGDGRAKQPYHLADPDGRPLAFAGIWSTWRDPSKGEDEPPLASAAILTTRASGTMAQIHARMPVILPSSWWADWLGTSDDAPHLSEAISALEAPRLTATPIGDRVNSVRNDGPDLLVPGTVGG